MAGFDESLSGLARVRPEAMSGRLVGDTIFGQFELFMCRLDCHYSKTTFTEDCSPFTNAEQEAPGLKARGSLLKNLSAFSNRSELPQIR